MLPRWKTSCVQNASDLGVLPTGAAIYGWVVAGRSPAHARTGDRIAIASYLGGSDAFDRAVADYSVAYADQNERDYKALKKAVADGRIVAQSGL